MANQSRQRKILAPKFPLNVLLLEDNPDDAELCLRVLRKAQFEIDADIVRTPEEFAVRLQTGRYDIILADYNLGVWTGMDALDLLHKHKHDIPLILVTGHLGDQAAVECVKNGAADYVLKDGIERLPLAIYRAIEDTGSRTEQRRAECLLQESESKFRLLTEAIPVAVFVEQDTQCCYVNHEAEHITGYSRPELLGMRLEELILPRSRPALNTRLARCLDGLDESTPRCEAQILNKNGEERWLDITLRAFQIKGRLAALIAALDVTDRKNQKGQSTCLAE